MIQGKTTSSILLTFGVIFLVCISLLCVCAHMLIGLLIFYYLWSYEVEMEILCTPNTETKENLEKSYLKLLSCVDD